MNGNGSHVGYIKFDTLPFKIIYTDIVSLWLRKYSVILEPA